VVIAHADHNPPLVDSNYRWSRARGSHRLGHLLDSLQILWTRQSMSEHRGLQCDDCATIFQSFGDFIISNS